LHEITRRQREELKELHRANGKLRGRLKTADGDIFAELARADEAVHGFAKRAADERAHGELVRVAEERHMLEKELAMWRSGTARLRAAKEAEACQDAKRGTWLIERRRLEQAVAAARERLGELSEREEWETADFAARRSSAAALREELVQQRRQRTEADYQLRAAEAQLAGLRNVVRVHFGGTAADAESSKLSDARLQLAGVSEARKRQAEELQERTGDLDGMKKELAELTEDNERLRAGLHWGLQSLERIENELVREPSAGQASRHSDPRREPQGPSSPRSPAPQPRERPASARRVGVGLDGYRGADIDRSDSHGPGRASSVTSLRHPRAFSTRRL